MEKKEAAYDLSTEPESFETGIGDWYADNGIWQVGIPKNVGPAGAHAGSQCAGTVIDGNYPGFGNSRLISPNVALPSISANERLLLRFWQWMSSENAVDYGKVQLKVAGTNTWQALSAANIDGASGGWTQFVADLTAYADSSIQIGFYFVSDSDNNVGAGWYIDEVRIEKKEAVYDLSAIPEGFEIGIADWHADNGIWQVGIPQNVGPQSAHAGSQCAGTIIGGNYPVYSNSRLISPEIQLPSLGGTEILQLGFWHWWDFDDWSGTGDVGTVQISINNGAWQNLSTVEYDNDSKAWTQYIADLTAYADSSIRIGFYFVSDYDNNPPYVGAGWYVDDVRIEKKEAAYDLSTEPESFETGIGDWYADNGIWQVGTPRNVGPQSPHTGSQCAGTVIDGNYPGFGNSRLISPEILLSASDGNGEPRLVYWHWMQSETTDDKGIVQILANGTWTPLSVSYSGQTGNSWKQDSVNLSSYIGDTVRFAFYFTSDNATNFSGWYVDDIQLKGVCQYQNNVGTVSIISPSGSVPVGNTIIPSAVVKNYGDETAIFPVTFQIGADYNADTILVLQPGQKDTLFFTPWTANLTGTQSSTYIARCRTDWANDPCPLNDEITTSVAITNGTAPFITSITPQTGGNTGSVTTEIHGKYFQPGIEAWLTKGQNTLFAYNVAWLNEEKLYASFDLSRQELGKYDVQIRNPDFQEATFFDGFEVVDGAIGWGGVAYTDCPATDFEVGQLLEIEVQRPAGARPNRVVPMTIHYRNTGNIDLPLPTRVLTTLNNVPLSLTEGGLSEQKTELFLELRELGGPANVLRAGASGSIKFYVKTPPTAQTLEFRLME
ncbi:MAG: choice-of-anchor J domain-containing protein [Saprospiraceae bacterium]